VIGGEIGKEITIHAVHIGVQAGAEYEGDHAVGLHHLDIKGIGNNHHLQDEEERKNAVGTLGALGVHDQNQKKVGEVLTVGAAALV
jgi:hypothetical protein